MSSAALDYASFVCLPEQAVTLSVADCLADHKVAQVSPIDDFNGITMPLVKLGTREFVEGDPARGRLLLLGLVGGTEHYFRSVLAGLVSVCPVCQASSASEMVPLSAIVYYSPDRVSHGLLEGASLSGKDSVINKTKKLTGIEIKPGSSLSAALAEFDKLCELRHASVHSRGELQVKNLLKLSMSPSSGEQQKTVEIDQGTFQTAVAVCKTAVRAYNRHVFSGIIEQWIGRPVFEGAWDKDRDRFTRLFNLFVSREDMKRANAYNCYQRLKRTIDKRLSGRV